MTMVEIETMAELADFAGEDLEVSDWLLVDQALIDRFAEDTRGLNWYHVDVERAGRELPRRQDHRPRLPDPVLVPWLAKDIIRVRNHGRALNYGLDKVRFLAPVPAGSRFGCGCGSPGRPRKTAGC